MTWLLVEVGMNVGPNNLFGLLYKCVFYVSLNFEGNCYKRNFS